MPGTLTIKPVQADLHCNKDLFKKMDPYCEFLLGGQKFKTSVCRRGGKHPHWSDTFNAQVNNETKMHIRMLDKDTFKSDDYIGMCEIDLRKVSLNSKEWYPIFCKQTSIGEILLEISYTPQGQLPNQQFIGQPMPVQQGVQHPEMAFSNPTFCPPEQMQTTRQTAQPIVVFNCPAFSNGNQPMTVFPQGQQMDQSVRPIHRDPPTHSVSIRSFEKSDSNIAYAPTLSSLNSIAMSQSQTYSGPGPGPRQGA